MSMFGTAPRPGGMFSGLANNADTMIMAGLGLMSGRNPQEQFAGAMQGYGAGSQMDRQRREQAEKDKLAADQKAALEGAMADPAGPFGGLPPGIGPLMATNPDLAHRHVAEWLKTRTGVGDSDLKYGLNPVWGQNEAGETGIGTLGNDGTFKQIDTGAFSPREPVNEIDLGTSVELRGGRTGTPQGTLPKDVAGVERQQVIGQTQGAAEASIPKATQAAQALTAMLNDIRDDPNREYTTGWMSNLPTVAGGARRGFQKKVDQVRGQVFLQAFEMLKGAGAITQQEGAAATDAATRLQTDLSDEDFMVALNDLQALVDRAVENLRARAAAGQAPPQPVPQANGGVIDMGDGITVRPLD